MSRHAAAGQAEAFYNENDPKTAAWLRELIAAGLIAPGVVDERSITELNGVDLGRYTQVHLFAGIGGWPLALRLAGWPDDRPIWTGSCPCQPFANPGKKRATEDPRHLWPDFYSLVRQCRPAKVFGEQVESPAGRTWLAAVLSDLEASGYAAAAAGLPAAGVGAPQGRARLWWVADADYSRWQGSERQGQPHPAREERTASCRESLRSMRRSWPPGPCEVDSIPLLANGDSGAMGGCKGYGNAIVPQVAAAFIEAYCEVAGISLPERSVSHV